jgi:2-methylcitrate dehydratase
MVVGYELFTRISDAAQLRERGWDQGYAVGLATAASVGNLLGLPRDQIAHGISITATANVPLRATRAGQLSLWKGAATAYAVRNGVFGMLLAGEGMTGPDRPFEGRHGLWEQITGPFELAPFGGRGGKFSTPLVNLKYWPVEYNAQAGVWAAQQARARVPVEQIAEVAISTYWSAWHEIGSEPEKWDPQTRETADHSLPYVFAWTLLHGSLGLDAFDRSSYLDPAIRPLMQKIRVAQDDAVEARWPAEVVMRVRVTSTSGESHDLEVVNPLGHGRNPMQDEDITAKFERLSLPLYGQARTRQLLDQWWQVSSLASFGEALDLLDRAAVPAAS